MVNTGSGHVLLAYAPPYERALMFEEHEWMPHEVPPPNLEERLKQVRTQGYESMDSLQTAGVSNLSVPILGANGTVLAALTCPFVRRIDNREAPDRDQVLRLLIQAGKDMSGSLSS
jgi:DNA-binding IclR family transcriptional regulator